MKLRATKALKYNTRRLLPGDVFDTVKDRDARILLATRKVVRIREPANVPAPPAAVAAKIAAAVAPVPPPAPEDVGAMTTAEMPNATTPAGDDELATVRAEYEAALGKKAFWNWDVATLREKIAAAKAEADAVIAYQEAGVTVVLNERGEVQPGLPKPRLALVMPYYRNQGMLAKHLQVWRDEWSPELKRDVEIVIVDDGSPVETAADVLLDAGGTGLPRLSLYRMTEDRLWGQHAARNRGAKQAVAPWLLMTDMDHVVPPATLREVLAALPLGKREVITFGRVDAPPMPDWRASDSMEFARTLRDDGTQKPHVNSFLIARKQYWKLGGYDESFVGIYGCDQEFRTRLWKRATERHLDHAPLIRVAREVIPDASTRDVERKTNRSAEKKAVRAAKAARGEVGVIKMLQFPWERVL